MCSLIPRPSTPPVITVFSHTVNDQKWRCRRPACSKTRLVICWLHCISLVSLVPRRPGNEANPWCAVARQFWFVVPLLTHQSPYRTGALFLPILALLTCQNMPNGFQNVPVLAYEHTCIYIHVYAPSCRGIAGNIWLSQTIVDFHHISVSLLANLWCSTFLASFPVPRPAFRYRTASDEKLGVGLGMRRALSIMCYEECAQTTKVEYALIIVMYQ